MSQLTLIVSALAHIGLLILAAIGLPALSDPPDPLENEVRVMARVVSERSEAKAPLPPEEPPAPETPPAPPEPEPVAAKPPPVDPPPVEPPPAEPPPEEPVEVAALTPEPPKPEPPKPEPLPEPPVAAPKPPPPPQEPPPEPTQAKPPPKPPEPAPKPAPAPKPPPDELAALRKAAAPPRDDLDTLRSALPDRTPVPASAEEAEDLVFTVAEKQRLGRQLTRCWQTIPGLAPSARHVVMLQVALSPDGRVTSIEAIDAKSGRSYRAARERAERALRHPFCEQLDLPPAKMALWLREPLTLEFDPRQMQ